MLLEKLTLIISSIFTGAAIYINFIEQPARLLLSNSQLLTQWKASYKRGFIMQASLSLIAGLLGIFAFISNENWFWLIGSIIISVNWPYTLIAIMPTNKKLLSTTIESANDKTRKLIQRWNILHSIRTFLGMLSVISFSLGSDV